MHLILDYHRKSDTFRFKIEPGKAKKITKITNLSQKCAAKTMNINHIFIVFNHLCRFFQKNTYFLLDLL